MTIERTYHFPGWVLITEHSAHPGEPPGELQFCCWDCVLKYAAKFPPPERIEIGGAE